MEARILRMVLIGAIFASMGASWRTRNFIVTAPTQELAQEIGEQAERFRRELAEEWLEQELPPWQQPCPITAHVSPQLGAGGATSFMFDRGRPFGWEMTIQGSRERILDSVLPHEVTHTIFATHFGRPLPRWADEGACTTVEHVQERHKQQQWLINFLRSERGIPFNRMFAMTEYPNDIMPLYAQGYSVARFLIGQGGKPHFVQFLGQGMSTSDWTSAVREFYGFSTIGDLQLTWVDWVRDGSPDPVAWRQQQQPESPIQFASASQDVLLQPSDDRGAGNATASAPRSARTAPATSGKGRTRAAGGDEPNWYLRQQHQQAARSADAGTSAPRRASRPQRADLPRDRRSDDAQPTPPRRPLIDVSQRTDRGGLVR